jgi:hypothetical protein
MHNLTWLLIFTELLSEISYIADESIHLVTASRCFQIFGRVDLSLERSIQ